MKKLNLLFVILASFGLITMSSCNGDDPAPIVKDITISVSGGTEVTVEGTNIAKDITVTATEKTTKDVVVNITSNAAEGEATIEPAQITIKKGEISATSKITFASAKFPEGTAQKKITVTINSTTEGVKLGTPTTDFLVKGAGGPELIALTITANGTEFNTTTEAKELSVVFTLAEALTEKVAVTITVDPSSSEIFKTMFPTIPPVEIPANEKTLTIPFTMPKGTEGLLKINFAVTNLKVDLKTASLSATFVVDEDPAAPPTFSLARTTTGDIVVPATGDKAETFKVTLSKAAAEEQTITLTATPEGGVLSPASVVFAIGETSKDVTITFQSLVFTSDLVTKDIVVTGASTVLTAKTASITYKVIGTKVEVPTLPAAKFTIADNQLKLGGWQNYHTTDLDGQKFPSTTPLPMVFTVTAADGTDITSHCKFDHMDASTNNGGGYVQILSTSESDTYVVNVGDVITITASCVGLTFAEPATATVIAPPVS